MLEKKGRNIVILDVDTLTDISRFFVVCSCDNEIHVRAVAESVRDSLAEDDVRAWKTEGWNGRTWVILDYVDIVVHVFYEETRRFYNLERLWADAPIEEVGDEPRIGEGGFADGSVSEAEVIDETLIDEATTDDAGMNEDPDTTTTDTTESA